MRKPKYLSPSSIMTFWKDREEYYLKYMADCKPPRLPQTEPMAVGSAFDAYVKSFLHHTLFGNYGKNGEFGLDALFETQVEPQNRDFARRAGADCFAAYVASDALSALMDELLSAGNDPQFEITVTKEVDGVPILGKPDIYFHTSDGIAAIIDWKVNGYCSRSRTSPKPGYISVKDGWIDVFPESRGNGATHKNARIIQHHGLAVNAAQPLNTIDEQWAMQTFLYLRCVGEPAGTDAIVGIDQLVGYDWSDTTRLLRVARHRTTLDVDWQINMMEGVKTVWNAVSTGNPFFELPRDEAKAKIAELDIQYRAYEGTTPQDKWLTNITRQHSNY